METIFLTGATGFIGKNFIERVKRENEYRILAFVDKDDKHGIEFLERSRVDFITIDDLETYKGSIDYCLHLASYGVSYGARNVSTMIDVNIKLTMRLADFCSNHLCKLFINTGSCFEYGSQIQTRKITETDSLNPEDIYAASKVACEDFLRVYSSLLNLKYITIRPFSIYGKYESPQRIIPLVFKSGSTNVPLNLTAGEQIRDYMNVKDVVDAIFNIIVFADKTINGEAINICTGHPTQLKSFILLVANYCDFDSTLFRFGAIPYRKKESIYFCGDNTRLLSIIGERKFENTKSAILDCYNDFKKANII